MSFGFSVGDVIKLLELSAKVYIAFADAKNNSTAQVKILVEEFNSFHESLKNLKDLLEIYKRPVPNACTDFEKTLEDCYKFIKPYAEQMIDRGSSFKKGLRSLTFTFKKEEVELLRAQIHAHVQVLMLFTSHLQLQLSFEAQQLQLPSPALGLAPVRVRASTSSIKTAKHAPIEQNENQILYEESQKLSNFLEGSKQPPVAVSVDRDVFVRVRNEVNASLERLEYRSKRVAVEQRQHDPPSGLGMVGIVETPTGSPNIHIVPTEGAERHAFTPLPPPAQDLPGRSDTIRTLDSAIDVKSFEETERRLSNKHDSEPLFSNPWVPQDDTTRPRPESVTSVVTFGTVSSYADSFATSSRPQNPSTARTTPYGSPDDFRFSDLSTSGFGGPSSMQSLSLPSPTSFAWELLSEAAEVEYCTDKGWHKSAACIISRCYRVEDGGISLRTTMKATQRSIYQHLPPTSPPIPCSIHDMVRDQRRMYISFPQCPRGTFKPTAIKDVKYTFLNVKDSEKFQNDVYQQTLAFSRNIHLIESDQRTEECRNQSLRLFANGEHLILLFYTNRRDNPIWVEEAHVSFERLPESVLKKSSSKELKLHLSQNPEEHAKSKIKRSFSSHSQPKPFLQRSKTASSVSSGGSTNSSNTVSPDRPMNIHKFKWIKLHFQSSVDRADFISIWHTHFRPIL